MNNADFFTFFLKNTLSKALANGGFTIVEEFAEQLPMPQLGKLIEILKKVEAKRKNVVTPR